MSSYHGNLRGPPPAPPTLSLNNPITLCRVSWVSKCGSQGGMGPLDSHERPPLFPAPVTLQTSFSNLLQLWRPLAP